MCFSLLAILPINKVREVTEELEKSLIAGMKMLVGVNVYEIK